MWPSNNIVCKITKTKLLVITSPKAICQSLWARDIDTCRKTSSTILWESGSKSAGEPIRAYVSADLAPNIRRHHARGDRIQSKWRDPNPRGIQIRAQGHPNPLAFLDEWSKSTLTHACTAMDTAYWNVWCLSLHSKLSRLLGFFGSIRSSHNSERVIE